jgi:hypothetical protein
MTAFLTRTWEFIAGLPVGAWAVIGGLVAALIAALVSLWNTGLEGIWCLCTVVAEHTPDKPIGSLRSGIH